MDGIDGVGTNYSSFVPSYRSAKNVYFKDTWMFGTECSGINNRIQNLRFAQSLCVAQKMGESLSEISA